MITHLFGASLHRGKQWHGGQTAYRKLIDSCPSALITHDPYCFIDGREEVVGHGDTRAITWSTGGGEPLSLAGISQSLVGVGER